VTHEQQQSLMRDTLFIAKHLTVFSLHVSDRLYISLYLHYLGTEPMTSNTENSGYHAAL